MESINVTDFRKNISDYIFNVRAQNKQYVLLKCGKPVAIISPLPKPKPHTKKKYK